MCSIEEFNFRQRNQLDTKHATVFVVFGPKVPIEINDQVLSWWTLVVKYDIGLMCIFKRNERRRKIDGKMDGKIVCLNEQQLHQLTDGKIKMLGHIQLSLGDLLHKAEIISNRFKSSDAENDASWCCELSESIDKSFSRNYHWDADNYRIFQRNGSDHSIFNSSRNASIDSSGNVD